MEFKNVVQKIMESENLKSELAKLKSFDEVHKFFSDNGYEGSEQKLRKELFERSGSTAYEIPEAELDQVAGGANGRRALAACAGIAMLLSIPTPPGINNEASAKMPFFESVKTTPYGQQEIIQKSIIQEDIINGLKNELDKVAGQEKAKEQVMSFFEQYTEESKTSLPAPRVLIFNGPSGTGKTFMAQLLSRSITGISPFFISADDVLKTSKENPAAMPYAFFYGNTQNGGNSKEDMSTKTNNLMSFLKSTKGTIRFVIFDGWDKIYQKDSSGNYPDISQMDETWRGILSNQYTDYTGEHIDLSGTIFIITTNETTASLQGRIEVDSEGQSLVEALVDERGNPILDEYGERVYGKPHTDSSQKQSIVPHDASLMEHLSGHIFYFNK